MAEEVASLDDWLLTQPLSHDLCFLCGTLLDKSNKTDEHIIPQWIQKDFNLWGQPLTLPNGTTIPYGQLKIPCCFTCNNGPLHEMEDEVCDAVRGGYDHFIASVKPLRIFQWLQCVSYKLLFKELRLKEDRRAIDSRSIVTPQELAGMRLAHLFLRSIDKKVKFEDFIPGSVYALKTKTSSDNRKNFDYRDSLPEQCIFVRMGEVGLIGVLNDGGLQREVYPDFLKGIAGNVLNPVQLKNAFAKCLYVQRIFNDPFVYGISPPKESVHVIERALRVMEPGTQVYGEFNNDDYAETLAAVLRCQPEAMRLPDGRIGSLFFDMEGNWKDRPFDDTGECREN